MCEQILKKDSTPIQFKFFEKQYRQTDRQTDRQTYRQTDRQTEREERTNGIGQHVVNQIS